MRSGAGKDSDTRVGPPGECSLERFEEDVLIFTHAVPKERKITIGPRLLQQFPKSSPQREIGLELLKSRVLQLEEGATQLLKLIRLRLGKDLQEDVSEHYKRFLHRSARLYQQSMQHLHCRGIKTCMNEPCRQSNPCLPRERTNPRPRKSLLMSCVDFFCWKTWHSQDQSKCLSSALRVRATRTITLQTR